MAMSGAAASANISSLRDIMSTYNKMTHTCFQFCVSNLNYPKVTSEEESCINKCSSKYINGNNRAMATFIEIQTRKQKALIEEAEQKEREKLAGNVVDTTPDLPGPATAANLLFNTGSSTGSQPPPSNTES